ncbi:MAG: D-alanyl-D-alanine carboxypeptidase [Blastocatellia bacterium]|nr:D-alanyl-D-alanine carboxypeptidase [Blastocatellia bacterium]
MNSRTHKLLFVVITIALLGFLTVPFRSLYKKNRSAQPEPVATAQADAKLALNKKSLFEIKDSVDIYLKRLNDDGCLPDLQAVLIQKMDGEILAQHNIDTPLNPASVMKLATSYLALKRYGPDHRFKTIAYTTGVIDESKQVLYGDLVIEAEGDPHFTMDSAAELASAIRSQGIKRVEGKLVFNGPLRLFHRWSQELAYAKMRAALGLSFPNFSKNSKENGLVEAQSSNLAVQETVKRDRVLLAVHYSKPLRELLLYMNAHSDNFYADQLGEAMGGSQVVQDELTTEFRLKPGSLYISHTSGLEYNRISAKASLQIMKKMIAMLKNYSMKVEDIMPVAGVDSGTLATRFTKPETRGAIVGKTGTLTSTDSGVSVLQGVVYTEKHGPLLFAIFNTGGGVHYFRKLQDMFLVDAMQELKTDLHAVRTENILAEPEEEVAKVEKKVKKASSKKRRR